ncbi:MAG: hypothetical protein QOG35_995 [Solirubrobacteraceae bacterium]|jgi:hypothetical protein|nr:hypothetical protein [Solirubrobacteraceae bacterium]
MHLRGAALWLVLFAVYAAGAGLHASPGEDLSAPEAHALLLTRSILDDGDLDLSDQYGAAAWRPFYGHQLLPLTGPREHGQLEPIPAGFPLLCAPAYALGGRIAVELWLAALAALGYVAAAALARRLVPEPWATGGALAVGLSPPAVVAATTIAPDAVAGTILAGAAALALAARERPLARLTAWAGTLLATLPWLAVKFLAPGAVVAAAVYRWPRRRSRGLAGLVGIELVLFSIVLFASINDRLYGGLTPYAVLAPGVSPTGAAGLGEHLARWPRLLWLWVGRDEGLLRAAPVCALAFAALFVLFRSRRSRLARVVAEQVDVEVAAAFLATACAAAVGAAVFLAPSIGGAWFAGHQLVAVLPLAAALCAMGLRRFPRTGRALAALTLAGTVWLLVAVRIDPGAGVAPPRGALPTVGR